MFRRSRSDAPDDLRRPSPSPAPQQAKGRPTPTRKEAEAARKAALTAPSDPKAARKADKDAQRAGALRGAAGRPASRRREAPPAPRPRPGQGLRPRLRRRPPQRRRVLHPGRRRRAGPRVRPGRRPCRSSCCGPGRSCSSASSPTRWVARVPACGSASCPRQLPEPAGPATARSPTPCMRSLQIRRLRLPRPRSRPTGSRSCPKAQEVAQGLTAGRRLIATAVAAR